MVVISSLFKTIEVFVIFNYIHMFSSLYMVLQIALHIKYKSLLYNHPFKAYCICSNAVKDHVMKYSETAFSNSNVKYFCSIKIFRGHRKVSTTLLSGFSSIFFRLFHIIHFIATWSYQVKVLSLVNWCLKRVKNLSTSDKARLFLATRSMIRINGAKEKYRGVFEIQRSGDKTSSGEICLDIRTHASPKVGQDQVFV